ncbi:hypothetical protein GY45DRAFT_1375935 [Cubamyces sp. BRFM 1775]|nr:hypothetical protein GY45DRAFT_1375935 [Cubamyces sp. BRFM 1775]
MKGTPKSVRPPVAPLHPADATLPLSIALVQPNLHSLDDYLLEIADPESPNYGKLWTPEKVVETFRPSKESVDVVHPWLTTDGIHPQRIQISENGAFVRENVSIAEAERLLETEYFTRTTLAKRPAAGVKRRAGLKESFKQITLDCVRQHYGFDYNIVTGAQNTVGVMELGREHYNGNDLDVFFKSYAPDQVGDRPRLMDPPTSFSQPSTSNTAKTLRALAGMTFVYASGGDGVSAFSDQCLSSNGTVVSSGDGGNRFFPNFPGSCPYLTAVDATEIKPDASISPSYILHNLNQAAEFTFAGKSPVGWINPALYASTFANIFNDITDGNNPGCGTQGFTASPGWDPVTGLGTMNFPRMLSRSMTLP